MVDVSTFMNDQIIPDKRHYSNDSDDFRRCLSEAANVN
jgi:hypothetical protein